MIITLIEAKKHLNIETAFTDDDEYITDLILVAENCIEKDLHRTLAEVTATETTLPILLKHAARLMIGNLYANREPVIIGVTVAEMPLSYKYLVSKYKFYTVG